MGLQRTELFVRNHRSFPDFRIIGLETIEPERKGHDQGNGEDNPEPSRMECLLNYRSVCSLCLSVRIIPEILPETLAFKWDSDRFRSMVKSYLQIASSNFYERGGAIWDTTGICRPTRMHIEIWL
jgi:hypothetical protein